MPLADYKAQAPVAPRHNHMLELMQDATEFLRQSEALRQDFPLREAKLRQAADLFDDASERADEMIRKLDEKARNATRATEAATQARQAAKEVLGLVETRHTELMGAVAAAQGVQLASEDVRQGQYKLLAEIDAAKLEVAALLEDARAARAESLGRALPMAPGGAPGDFPAPGLTAIPTMYPAGPTTLGFLYPLIEANDLTGGIDLSSGPSLQFSATAAAKSGAFGLYFDKAAALDTNPHSIIWEVGGVPTWEIGQDFDTDNSGNGGSGNSDFVLAFDHTANAAAGADILRLSPAEADSVSATVDACKLSFVGTGTGSPRDNTHLVTFSTGTAVDLGGVSTTIKSQNARDHITLVNAHATSKRNVINFGGFWKMGSDIGGAGTAEWVLRDNTNSLNRLYVEQTSAIMAKVGVNTTGPLAGVHSAVSNDASLENVIQSGLAVGYSTINNRTWQVQYILDATQAQVINWLFGTLGSTSTRATPTATSATIAYGIKANQVSADLICAASGTNTTIASALSWTNSAGAAQLGVLGATPVSKQGATTDLKDVFVNFGFLTDGGATPLNLDNGALTAGALVASTAKLTSTLGGSATAFKWNRQSFTFAADANETVDATVGEAVILDVQAGVISATREITLLGSGAGTFLYVINRNAQSVTVKLAGGTGITVAATRAAAMAAPGGTNMFRLSADVDYTT